MRYIFGLIAFILIAGGILWAATGHNGKGSTVITKPQEAEREDGLQRFARLATACELCRIHASEIYTRPADRLPAEDLRMRLIAEAQLDASWTAKIIRKQRSYPDHSLAEEILGTEAVAEYETRERTREIATLTDFEKRAIKKIEEGANEVLESPQPGRVLYMRPVHLEETCRECHVDGDPASYPQTNGLALRSNAIDGAKISLQITLSAPKPRPE